MPKVPKIINVFLLLICLAPCLSCGLQVLNSGRTYTALQICANTVFLSNKVQDQVMKSASGKPHLTCLMMHC